jgi:hypothetical protein
MTDMSVHFLLDSARNLMHARDAHKASRPRARRARQRHLRAPITPHDAQKKNDTQAKKR